MAAVQEPNPFRLELPEMQFGTIYADPPWPLDQENTLYSRRRILYDRMSEDEIKAIPIPEHSTPDAHLWLWTTNAHLPLALRVVEAWGFHYKTMATWRKTKITTGWWLRGRTEHLIFAARSNNLRHNPGTFTTEITGAWTAHSVKPPVRLMIESLSPGPYLELFNRDKHDDPRWYQISDDRQPSEPFGQLSVKGGKADPNDGKVRGVGGLEIVPGQEYQRLVKVIVPEPVVVIKQTGRRVQVRTQDGTAKWVTVDALRAQQA